MATCLQSHIGASIPPPGLGVVIVASSQKAVMRVQAKKKVFLIDTGAGANLISTHEVDISMLKLVTPG